MDWPIRLVETGFLIEILVFHGHLMGFQTVFDTGILVEIIVEFRGHLMGWQKLHFQTEFWSTFLNYLIRITRSSEDFDSCARDLKPSGSWIWKNTNLGNMYLQLKFWSKYIKNSMVIRWVWKILTYLWISPVSLWTPYLHFNLNSDWNSRKILLSSEFDEKY